VKIAGAGLVLLMQIVLARLLGAEEYGVYTYALAWVMIFMVFSRGGMDTVLVKYIPIHCADNERGKIRALLLVSGVTLIAVSSFCMLAGFAGSGFLIHPEMLVRARLPLLYASILMGVFLSVAQLLQAMLRGSKQLVMPEVMDNIVRPLALVLLFVAIYFCIAPGARHETGAFAAMLAAAGAALLNCAIMLYTLRSGLFADAAGVRADFSPLRGWIGLAMPMMMMTGANDLIDRMDTLMIGNMMGPEQTGVYSVAARLAELSLFGLTAANGVLGPFIAEYHHTGQKARLQKILTFSAWIIFAVMGVIILGLVALGPFVLKLFGPGFSRAYVPMLILLAGQAVNALTGPVGALLMLTGHQLKAIKILMFKAALNFGGNIVLIPLLGIDGAATAAAITIGLSNLVVFFYVFKLLDLNSSVFRLRPAGGV
jgi:O-antigen/teichoic acid export membrane protein